MSIAATHSALLANVPPELADPKFWLQYYHRPNKNHPDKPDKCPCEKFGTDKEKDTNCRSLPHILNNREPKAGVQRLVMKSEKLVYIDLDHVRNPETQEIEPWAERIVNQLDSYTEISASGEGLHIVCKGTLPEDVEPRQYHKDCKVEIYSGAQRQNKLIAFTGNLLDEILYHAVENRQAALEALLSSVKSNPLAPSAAEPLPIDWRKAFRSGSELQEGPVRILINNILPEGTTFLGAAAGTGKTWFALSMARALATGKKFLGTFEVPERVKVLYLIPEQGDRSLRARMEKLRMPMDGETIRVRTQKDGILRLTDDPSLLAAVKEWHPVIFLDTAIRFTAAVDENSSSQNQNGLFVAICGLMQAGATSIVANHHISKRFAESEKGKLPRAQLEHLRGTSDLGAMIDTCWMLQPDDGGGQDGYLEESRDLTRLLVRNVKPRDLLEPAEDFVIQGRPHIDDSGDFRILAAEDFAQSEHDVDDRGRRAAELIRANPKLSKTAVSKKLGCSRNDVASAVLSHGWQWKETSRTTGFWIQSTCTQPLAPGTCTLPTY